jgi:hypothetical protein
MSTAANPRMKSRGRSFLNRLGVCTVMLIVLGSVLSVAGASATYEQVGTFAGQPGAPKEPGVYPEEVQLGGVGSMAVNINGAGGVPAGTIYALGEREGEVAVVRYDSDGSFREEWRIGTGFNLLSCGPEGELAQPICPAHPNGSQSTAKLAVDQATGDVYVLDSAELNGAALNEGAIRIYSPNGSELIARFGELAPTHVTTAADPELIHREARFGIAVSDTGTVYVADENSTEFHHRVMVFEPVSPGDYSNYAYTGENHDIAPGGLGTPYPAYPVLDDAGNIYGMEDDSIVEYSTGSPAKRVCKYSQPDGGIVAMTVNQVTGAVFYFDSKNKKVHQLAPCNAQGEFIEVGSIPLSPTRRELGALAFDPNRRYSSTRVAGVLYGGSPSYEDGAAGEMSSIGYVFAPSEGLPPTVAAESVTNVSAESAVLQAGIDPNGAETVYSFQYISDATYQANPSTERFAGATVAPLGKAPLGGGAIVITASAAVSALLADTEYHYRVIADNCTEGQAVAECTTTGAVETFHTYPAEAPGLPDGRTYELVSPVAKEGGEVFSEDPHRGSCAHPTECKPGSRFDLFPMQSTPDGEAVVYEGTPFSSSKGALRENEYLSRRTESGWQTATLSPNSLGYGSLGLGQYDEYRGYEAFSSDLTEGLFLAGPEVDAASGGYPNLYRQSPEAPSVWSAVVGQAPVDRSPGTSVNKFGIRYVGGSTDLSHVFFVANDALTGETAFAPSAVDGGSSKYNLYEWHGGALSLVNVAPGNAATVPGAVLGGGSEMAANAVSKDGTRAFWSSEAGQVYVRIDGQSTTEVPDHVGKFLTASADGSRVLLSDGQLFGHLEESVPVKETDLTAGKGGFLGVLGAGEDLGSIYFADTAVLAGENTRGVAPSEGNPNLYEWREGVTTFIATSQEVQDWAASSSARSAEASPDGRRLAFVSSQRLTGFANTGPCGGTPLERLEAPCSEDFLYDAASGDLVCVTCARSDAGPAGSSSLPQIAAEPGQTPAQPRYLTDSGRLLFDTPNALSAGDTNGAGEDVYEFEPNGVGTCGVAGGCVYLISSGRESADSNFLAMDEDGRNVFFTTRDRLVAADKDELVDLYDAREGGGFAAGSEPSGRECAGETCQGAVPAVPLEALPGSSTVAGGGNLVAPMPGGVISKVKVKALTRAQKLEKALRACGEKAKRKRPACERSARKTYGTKSKAKKAVSERKAGRAS